VTTTSLTLRVARLGEVPMPPVCARTGRPADGVSRVTIWKTPGVAWLGLAVFGWFAFWALSRRFGRRLDVMVPTSSWVWRRKAIGLASTAVGVLGLLAIGTVAGESRTAALALLLAFLVLVVVGPYLYLTASIDARWVGDDRVRLSRLDPAFAAMLGAAVEQRG
jgi:hypothetical protein